MTVRFKGLNIFLESQIDTAFPGFAAALFVDVFTETADYKNVSRF